MAFIIHLVSALFFYLLRRSFPTRAATPAKDPFSRFTLSYMIGLVTICVIPYCAAETLRILVHTKLMQLPMSSFDSGFVLLVPHYYMLIIQKDVLKFIQLVFDQQPRPGSSINQ